LQRPQGNLEIPYSLNNTISNSASSAFDIFIYFNILINYKIGGQNMKFLKGVLIGTLISAGAMMMYNENMGINKKQMMRKGRQIAKKMGVM